MSDFQKIINIIKTVRNKIVNDTDVVWAGCNSATDLQVEIDNDLDKLEKGDLTILDKFKHRFLPTATFQEVSLSNGWGDEFIELANKFDELYEKIK
ncbi:MAG: hypothetical protein EPN85_10025 [Bacteroidetes bacterium]|nr:MAG: hypothetical protein EPN85_10025 [Bacteroidota bacterium]